MKKIIISLLLLVPILTGCANIDSQLTINDDNTASIVSSVTYMGNLADKSDADALTIVENYKKYLDPLYTLENAYGSKFSTITATKTVKDLRHGDIDLSSLGFKSNLKSGKFVEIKKNMFVTSYNIDLTYDLPAQSDKVKFIEAEIASNKAPDLNAEYFQKYSDPAEFGSDATNTRENFIDNLDEETRKFMETSSTDSVQETAPVNTSFNASFSIKVPSFASYNNADSSELNVYTWNIKKDAPTEIKLQYVKYSGSAIILMLLAGVCLLILLARRILKHDSQKRIDN
ncbi:hypothetical protein HDR58_09340 [bacterium]|nr:hypothetical protein [bacterium]